MLPSITLGLLFVAVASAQQPEEKKTTGAEGKGPVSIAEPDESTLIDAPPYAGFLRRRTWASAEFLFWWTRGSHLPALVTTSLQGAPASQVGVLGDPGTSVLYGDSTVNGGVRGGGRFTLGTWLNDSETLGIGASAFILGDRSSEFLASSSGNPILARPIYDVTFPGSAAQILAYPNLATGQISISTGTDLVGADLFARWNLWRAQDDRRGFQVDALTGFRFLRMRDGLNIAESLTSTEVSTTALPLGTTFQIFDQFNTDNCFYGGDLGLQFNYMSGRLQFELITKLAMGVTNRTTTIQGATQVIQPGQAPQAYNAGFLAIDTNSGKYSQSEFSVVPELRFNIGYRITDRLRVFACYTLLYWTNVARAGDQVDLRVNPNYLPPVIGGEPRLPAYPGRTSGFWAQGLSLGLAFNF
jgi:hypothetical protein